MSNMHFPYSSAPTRTIEEIQFGLFSSKESERLAVIDIDYPETMDEARLKPRERGPNDPHLGTIDRNFRCATCEEDQAECPGHFGVIKLQTPVFHYGFLKQVKKILETVCHNCGKIKAVEDEAYKQAMKIRNRKIRFEKIWALSKGRHICESDPAEDAEAPAKPDKAVYKHGGCGNIQPEMRKAGLQLFAIFKPKKSEDDDMPGGAPPDKKRFFAEDALNVFRLINDETLETLGLNADYARPEWMILQSLPVPPPPVRPSISVDGSGQGQRGEDDLTFKLGDIVRANQAVGRTKEDGTPDHIKVDLVDLLQYHIATYMDNDIAGLDRAQHKSGRAIKSIRARLKGKEGRLRQNLMGKRVDFSARTVITGDPNLSLDEVGVPRSIARTLTYPEKVTRFNIEKLKSFVANGPTEHPGARYVIRDTGERIDLRIGKAREIALQYGWTVERHIQDGDVILFNRQPSLHKESMMAHRVRVMPYSTFRLNLSVTSPYNADFDGDEMNLHVPQSEESRSELRHLCLVPLNIVSPQSNAPLMGIVQDTLCGIYKICDKDVFLSKDAVMNILMWVPDWDGVIPQPAILKPTPRWTGKQIISMIIPQRLNLHKPKSGYMPGDDGGIFITEGQLVFGLLDKGIVGAGPGGIVHITFNEWGPDAAMTFFNGAQTVVNYWLLHNGFSVGIGDTIPPPAVRQTCLDKVKTMHEIVNGLIAEGQAEKLEPSPGMNIRGTFESKVSVALNYARDSSGTYMQQALKYNNGAVQMARSGSKGSYINLAQMMAIVGLQNVEGGRTPFGFSYRTLPHFTKDDYGPTSRGFVENSYLVGLTPSEFFFHAMAGREGLIDTAVKTAETGYIQRRLVKALEEATIRYDGTVRDSHGNVIQFLYGEDGLDGQHIEEQSFDILNISDSTMHNQYNVDVMGDEDPFKGKLLCWKDCTGDLALQELFDEEYENIKKCRQIARDASNMADPDFQLPLNIARIITQTANRYNIRQGSETDLDPRHAISSVNALMDKLVVVRGDDDISRETQSNATLLIRTLLRTRLAFKRLVNEHSITKLALDSIIGQVEKRFSDANAAPGEMVGVLAAQSIGEPATQMTLNTFHYTGVASKTGTQGVPRLKELLNVSTNIKTPAMTVYQIPENRFDAVAAKQLRSRVQHTNLRSLTETCELWFDPDIESTIIDADKDFVDAYWIIPDEAEADTSSHSRWLLRIVLNRAKMLDKGLTIDQIAGKMKSEYGRDLSILFSDQNAAEQVVRIRSVASFGKEEEEERQEDDDLLRRFMNEMLDNLTFNGIIGIPKVFISKRQVELVKDDGSYIKTTFDGTDGETCLETDGSAFAKVLSVEGVDATRTYTNVFTEIHEVLGIEAARAALYREIVTTLGRSYVNRRHVMVLCDGMTFRGYLSAISRHGINKSDNGPLMRCSFEQTVEILYEAAVNGELDDCTGVTQNIILGQTAPVGTGMMEVLLDDKMLSTIVSDNSNLGLGGPIGVKRQQDLIAGSATPYDSSSPMHDSGYLGSPEYGASFSPIAEVGAEAGGFSEYQPNSGFGGGFSPYGRSPGGYSPASPGGFGSTSPASPAYSPGGAGYSPTSPAFGPTSPNFGATSPAFSPVSPSYNATSPAYSPTSPTSAYSPTSPQYSPTSPNYSPTSPQYSPTSPQYSPTSPQYSPTSPSSPTSPVYSPTSPVYSPTSPAMGGGGKHGSPTSPQYSPTSPTFSPASPVGGGSPTSPQYSPTSPQFSPRSPGYSPTSPKND